MPGKIVKLVYFSVIILFTIVILSACSDSDRKTDGAPRTMKMASTESGMSDGGFGNPGTPKDSRNSGDPGPGVGTAESTVQKEVIQFISWGGIGSTARVKAAAAIGIDTHRLPVNPWPDERGNYNFEILDTYLPLLHRAGIKTVVTFYSHGVPDWFWKKYPDAIPRTADGNLEPWGRWAGSPWHPAVRKELYKGIKATFLHLKEKNLLHMVDAVEIGVGMEGQLSYPWGAFWAFDPYAITAYQQYLRNRYGEIDKLNAEWGSDFKTFSEITPPAQWEDTVACRVFLDFYRQALLNMAEDLSNEVAHWFNLPAWYWLSHFIVAPERPHAARYPIFYMQRLKKLGRADVVQTSVVPGWQTKDEIQKLQASGVRVIGEWLITPDPDQQRRQAQLAWDLECDGFFVGTLENLFDEQGNLTATGRVTAEVIKRWRANQRP